MRLSLFLTFLIGTAPSTMFTPPQTPILVDLQAHVPDLVCDARYAGPDNFVGRPLRGYETPICMGTPELAAALAQVQAHIRPAGLQLVVFDAYRPQCAVDELVRWTSDAADIVNKDVYYPHVDKTRLIPDGYIADKSGHSRGSTVDLSIADAGSGDLLDMGTIFDYFSPQSGDQAEGLTAPQRANRLLLRTVMEGSGFAPYDAEWWHFRLKDEPYPDTYFDDPVK